MGKFVDLTGQRFERLTAVEPTERRRGASVVWRCICDCGKEVFAVVGDLKSGNTKSCGCLRGEKRIVDLAGQRFGRLVVLSLTKKRSGGNTVWKCLCDCGSKTLVSANHLQSGHTKSCGCFQKEIRIKHGRYHYSEYKIWNTMIQRCENPKHVSYKYYGARGIKVCERWHKFENFYADMGPKPEGKSIDRIDNEGNYEPDNCRWSTRSEQRQNTRPTSCGPHRQRWFLAFDSNTGEWVENNNQTEFAEEYGLLCKNVSACLCGTQKTHKGWTFEFLPGC